jgi:hypothetical protein
MRQNLMGLQRNSYSWVVFRDKTQLVKLFTSATLLYGRMTKVSSYKFFFFKKLVWQIRYRSANFRETIDKIAVFF